MSGLNRFVGIGRLTKDVEVRKTSSGLSVANFTLAVNSRLGKEEKTDFISCIAWRQTADFLGQYAKKGNTIAIDGRIQTRNYDGADGKKVYVTEVTVDNASIINGSSPNGVNVVVLLGRLTKDVEVRKAGDISVASYTLACDRMKKDDPADFIPCVSWRQGADFLGQYAKKGNFVSVEGRIQTRSYDGEDGKKVYVTEVVTNSVKLFGNKSEGQSQAAATPAPAADEEAVENIETIDLGNGIDINDEDLPF